METLHEAGYGADDTREETLNAYTRNLEERIIPIIIVGAVALSFLLVGGFAYHTISTLQAGNTCQTTSQAGTGDAGCLPEHRPCDTCPP